MHGTYREYKKIATKKSVKKKVIEPDIGDPAY